MGIAEAKIYEFGLLKNYTDLVHGVFTRSGGASSAPFDSLNVGMNTGDALSFIDYNRKQVAITMGVSSLVFLNQVHGDDILILKKDDPDVSRTPDFKKERFTADGVVTDIKDVCLVIQVADCQAVMLYDPQKRVIANVHSGWRGSVKNIVGTCLDQMKTVFGCEAEHIFAGISPSLGPCCAEFVNYREEIPNGLRKYRIDNTVHFDFWAMTMDQLRAKGVKKEHIERIDICTKCNPDLFYSFRGEKTTGRFACAIGLTR